MIPFHKPGREFSHKNSAALPENGAVFIIFSFCTGNKKCTNCAEPPDIFLFLSERFLKARSVFEI